MLRAPTHHFAKSLSTGLFSEEAFRAILGARALAMKSLKSSGFQDCFPPFIDTNGEVKLLLQISPADLSRHVEVMTLKSAASSMKTALQRSLKWSELREAKPELFKSTKRKFDFNALRHSDFVLPIKVHYNSYYWTVSATCQVTLEADPVFDEIEVPIKDIVFVMDYFNYWTVRSLATAYGKEYLRKMVGESANPFVVECEALREEEYEKISAKFTQELIRAQARYKYHGFQLFEAISELRDQELREMSIVDAQVDALAAKALAKSEESSLMEADLKKSQMMVLERRAVSIEEER